MCYLLTSECNVAWSSSANGSNVFDPLASEDTVRGKLLPNNTCANRTVYIGGFGSNMVISLVLDTITLLPACSGIMSDILATLDLVRAANKRMKNKFIRMLNKSTMSSI